MTTILCPDCGKPAYGADHHYLGRCKIVVNMPRFPDGWVPGETPILRASVTDSVTRQPLPVVRFTSDPFQRVTETPSVTEKVVPEVTEIQLVTENVTESPKRMGRPVKSDAKSHAERQRAYRQRREA